MRPAFSGWVFTAAKAICINQNHIIIPIPRMKGSEIFSCLLRRIPLRVMPNRIQQIDLAHVQPSLAKRLIDNGTMRRHFAQEDDIVAGGIVIHTVGISERNGIAIVVVSP